MISFTVRDVRWLWVKLRRRVETPLRYRRIRAADAEPAAPSLDSAQAAPPWQDGAGLPGAPDSLPWECKRPTTLADPVADDVHAHRLQLLCSTQCLVNCTESRLTPWFAAATRELLPERVAAYRRIEWHTDFHSGYRWDPATFYLDVRVAPVAGADIKTPRELSRFQHVGALAQGDLEKGGDEFLLQVLDWIEANPPRRGVNWACTMDVALRVVNWVWGLRLFEPVLQKYPQALHHVAGSIREHGRHIEHNLEYYEESTGNHYLSDIAGLLYLSAAFPSFAESDRWLLFALQELVSEMQREVLADGGAHEASTHYHRLVAELFASCAALAERLPAQRRAQLQRVDRSLHRVRPRLRTPRSSGLNLAADGPLLPEAFYVRLARMAEFSAALTKPNGRVPQFGDNDSARVHKLAPAGHEDVRDHQHIAATIGELLARDDLRSAGAGAHEEAALVAGGLRSAVWSPLPNVSLAQRDIFFPDSGIAIARRGSAWLAVTCGPNGQGGRGGHGHNDKLSFELNVHGLDFVVDGGCPAYSSAPEMRNRYRSTWAHSTVAVVGMEQDPLPAGQGGLFRLPQRCRPRLHVQADAVIAGSHAGYGAVHRRRFLLTETQLTIDDELDSPVERWLVFNLDPAVTVRHLLTQADRTRCELEHAHGTLVTLTVEGAGQARTGEGCFALGYGKPVPTSNLQVRMLRPTTRTMLTWQR